MMKNKKNQTENSAIDKVEGICAANRVRSQIRRKPYGQNVAAVLNGAADEEVAGVGVGAAYPGINAGGAFAYGGAGVSPVGAMPYAVPLYSDPDEKRREEQAIAAAKARSENEAQKKEKQAAVLHKKAGGRARRSVLSDDASPRSDEDKSGTSGGGKKGNGGWIAAVASLGAAVIVLGAMLAFDFSDKIPLGQPNASTTDTRRAYYDFVGYVDNLETNLSKFFVSSDDAGKQKLLGEISVQSNLADAALGELPMKDESKYLTSKYINQLGDYAKYLNNRLIDGQTLSAEDYSRLEGLYDINVKLKGELGSLTAGLGEDYDFKSLAVGAEGDVITEKFDMLESSARDYPEMVYDGPFSDGIDRMKPKGLAYSAVDENYVRDEFKRLFPMYDVGEVKVVGKSDNGRIPTYSVTSMIKEGGELFAQFSVAGGRLVLMNAFRDCPEKNYNSDDCLTAAKKFLEEAGFKGMECVWRYEAGNTMRFNFAYTSGGVIYYPDLVKVNVCMETGRVSGLDADTYFMNHGDRAEPEYAHSESEAENKLNGKLEVYSSAKAVIPVGNGKEKPAYEFIGGYDGNMFYVYIDAATLAEADIFKVVETEEGILLV